MPPQPTGLRGSPSAGPECRCPVVPVMQGRGTASTTLSLCAFQALSVPHTTQSPSPSSQTLGTTTLAGR